jgi:FtsH-binding integral membrane protein
MQKQKSLKRNLFTHTLNRYLSGVFFALWLRLLVSPVFFYTRVCTYARSAHRRLPADKLALFVIGLVVLMGMAVNLARPVQTFAATNGTINFQARLEANTGAIVPDGTYNVEFKLYSASSGGAAEWTEDYVYNGGSPDQRIQVINGYLTANLGSITAFPNTINWDQQQWVTMNIGGTGTTEVATSISTAGWDGEMSPRLQLTAVPYAFRAGQLNAPGANPSSLTWATQSSTTGLLLPNLNGTLCVDNDTAGCGFAAGTGGTGYIQNQNASPQTTANFSISGSGAASTSFISPTYTGAGAVSLQSGGTNTNLTLQANGTGTATLDTGAAGGTVSIANTR